MSWIKKTTFLVIAILLPSLVGIILLEVYLKTSLGLGEPIVYDKSAIWGYSPRPQRVYKRFDGNIVSINDVGLRSTTSWYNNTNSKVLFLGDSVTYGGSYVSDNQVFPSLACNSLEEWSCFNGGVNAYGLLNMIARSRFDTRLEDADVIVFVFIWGDFLRGLQGSEIAHFILREPPKYFPATWEVLNFVSSRYAGYLKFGKAVDSENEAFNDPYLVASFAYENLKSEVARLTSLGKKVILISSPVVGEISSKKASWISIIENELLNEFPDSYYSLLTKQLTDTYNEKNKLVFKDGVHLEQLGHVIYGKLIGDILQKHIKLSEN